MDKQMSGVSGLYWLLAIAGLVMPLFLFVRQGKFEAIKNSTNDQLTLIK